MPKVFQAAADVEPPAYHVLVIGVSHYLHLPDGGGAPTDTPFAAGLGQLAAAATSAVRVALWFRDRFESPGAARGSIRLLVSPGPDEVPLPERVTVDRATARNVRREVAAWRRDLRTHPDNVAVLYVAGHGLQTSADGGIVLLEDFGAPESLSPLERAIDVAAVRRGIVSDPNDPDSATPQRQFYFYDACRVTPPAAIRYATLPVGVVLDEPSGTPPRASWVSFGSRPRDYALAVVETRTTLYSQAFLDCLDSRARPEDDGRTIRFAGLQTALEEVVSELATAYGERQDATLGGSGSLTVPVHRRPSGPGVPVGGPGGGLTDVTVVLDRAAPVLVRDEVGDVVAETGPDARMSLLAGSYEAVVPLPWGGEHVHPFTVSHDAARVDVAVQVPDSPSDLAQLPRLARQLVGDAGQPAVARSPLSWRLLNWVDGRFAIAGAEAPALSFTEDGTGTITVEAVGGRPAYLQIGSETGSSQLVALPVTYGPQSTCQVHVRSGDRGIATTVRLTDPELDAVGGYLSSGRADRALSALSGVAEDLLYGKIASPLGAALGGYVLLRLHALDRMHDWPENLARWFDWLPDGAVIAGTLAARRNDPVIAAEYLTTAAQRGVPLFSEGLSLLVAEAAALEHHAELPDALVAELAELVEPIQDLATTAAFGSLATGLRLGPGWADLLPEHSWSAVPALSVPAAPA